MRRRTTSRGPAAARRVAVLACAGVLTLGFAAGASGQQGQLEDTEDSPPVDLELGGVRGAPAGGVFGEGGPSTPVAKPTDLWSQVAGAPFGRREVPEGSATAFETDLHDVAFLNTKNGFTAGAECREPTPPEETGACERVPVIYQYLEPPGQLPIWKRVYRGDAKGFVGAIAWIGPGHAVAVGGDGVYPRREAPAGSPDPAGGGRAWSYRNGSWAELDLEDERAAGMRGMTALDFDRASPEPFGVAGALGQLWHWEGEGFTKKVDRESPTAEIARRSLFEFRVREIRFVPRPIDRQAFAVTSGCCAETPAQNTPRLLAYDGLKWHVRTHWGDLTDNPAGAGNNDPVPEGPQQRLNQRPDLPDSIFSLTVRETQADSYAISVVASPGKPVQPGERESTSLITDGTNHGTRNRQGRPSGGETKPFFWPDSKNLSTGTIRLVSSDGDSEPQGLGPPGNGVPDWVVGMLRSSDEGLGGQALAVSRSLGRPAPGEALTPSCPKDGLDANCRLEQLSRGQVPSLDSEKLAASVRSRVYRLPSYALNSVDVLDPTGIGWAVGDHGAILRLGGSGGLAGAAGAEPAAPELGAAEEARWPESAAYARFRPPTAAGEAGSVPSLRERPREQLSTPRWEAAGSPNPSRPLSDPTEEVRTIVMSEEGREGWAFGPGGPGRDADFDAGAPPFTLYRYQDETWTRCDSAAQGQLAADPACEGLEPLRRYRDPVSKAPAPVNLLAAARVPGGAGEFEVVAVGTRFSPSGDAADERPAVIRYSGGRWRIEDAKAVADLTIPGPVLRAELAFVAPDDGWMTLNGGPSFRFDGRSWVPCEDAVRKPINKEQCGNQGPDGERLPGTGDTAAGLTAVDQRYYLYGTRVGEGGGASGNSVAYPMILYRDRGPCSAGAETGCWRATEGGHDPGFGRKAGSIDPSTLVDGLAETGRVESLVVGRDAEGRLEGWAAGRFGGPAVGGTQPLPDATLLRLSSGGHWSQWKADDAARDYLAPPPTETLGSPSRTHPRGMALIRPGDGGGPFTALTAQARTNRALGFNPARARWELLPENPFRRGARARELTALASDGQGGAWTSLRRGVADPDSHPYFYRYTDQPRQEVFQEVANPVQARRITALTGQADGTLWLGTASSVIYRYSRLTGWDQLRVPGWDPRLATVASEVNAIAAGPNGSGIAVGKEGRIANLGPDTVKLDPAAGRVCDLAAPAAPCGTGRHLRAVAVAPDGSAIAAGDQLALLWRPAAGGFRAIPRPEASPGASFTGVAMPTADSAWLTADSGQVFAGRREGESWSWQVENQDEGGDLLGTDALGNPTPLRAIAVDEHGHGLAVGSRGLVLERDGDGWRRLETGFLDNLTAVALPAAGGEGALIGGENGVILTGREGRFELARAADPFRSPAGTVVGLSLLPGTRDGQVEAWAAESTTDPFASDGEAARLVHYASDDDDGLLNPAGRARPLPDSPSARPGEIAFAAFGKSECRGTAETICSEQQGSTATNELVTTRIVGELARRGREPAGPRFVVFTGDAYESAGDVVSAGTGRAAIGTTARIKYRRFGELVADRLQDARLPFYGAIGSQDLTEATVCELFVVGRCVTTKDRVKAGINLPWRREMVARAAPWGRDRPPQTSQLRFRPVGGPTEVAQEDVEHDPDGEGPLPAQRVEVGSARTHYAVDVVDDRRERPLVARLVFVDTSLRSLSAADPIQNPLEPKGGQAGWLEEMLCFADEADAGRRCTRQEGQQAVVVSTTPSYSYGPGIGSDTQTDAAAFEALLIKNRANLVVSGRIGWNGLYWALAPGLHEPCPGSDYPASPPQPGTRVCGRSGADAPVDPSSALPAAEGLASTLRGLGPPPPPEVEGAAGEVAKDALLPFVVASGGGGRAADSGAEATAAKGFWQGYSVVRLDSSGDPRATIVEQRPILDWIEVQGVTHTLRAGQRMTLRGVGREPVGVDDAARFDRIDSPAITHRYDLVEADPEKPWLPFQDEDGDYVALDPSIATVDSQTGLVTTGKGNRPRAYAIAILSVGEKSASYPIAFEPRKSFAPKTPRIATVPAPVARAQAAELPPLPSPQTLPAVANFTPPTLPPFPQIPPPPAVPPTATPTPPAPPAPPSVPLAAPLEIAPSPVSVTVAPPATVIPPPAPPIQPAPPSGARREARQRQAATAKSEQGSKVQEAQEVDVGSKPNSLPGASQATAREPQRPHPFTAVAHADQPSAWARTALYGGGLTLMALTLALGWTAARPTPRRRGPVVPAPAWGRIRDRR